MASGIFWQYNSGSGQIDTVLEKENVTLAEVLEQEDIIQECKNQNKKLVEFLTKSDVLAQLLDLILKEPGEDIDEKTRFKLPNIASELITCDVPAINEKLSSDNSLMDKMYSFLESSPPLNPLLASFFSKAFNVLISRLPEQNWYSYQFTCLQVINYIKSREGFTDLLLRHIHTSAIMDLLLRLITCVDGATNKQTVLDWLNETMLIEKVVDLFSEAQPLKETESMEVEGEKKGEEEEPVSVETDEVPAQPKEKTLEDLLNEGDTHDNAGHLLVEIIRGSRDAQMTATANERFHNSLLETVESKETVELLLNVMLSGSTRQSVIVNVVSVLLVLLEVRRPLPQNQGFSSDQDNIPNKADIDRQEAVVVQTCETIVPRLPEIVGLLTNPPVQPFHALYHSTDGAQEPLGATRIAVCKLLATLLATHNPGLNQALAQTPFLANFLDLSFNKFKQNNFLHHQMLMSVKSILFWEKAAAELDSTVQGTEKPAEDTLQTPKVMLEGEVNPLEEEVETSQNPLLLQLFTDARLFDFLTSAWETETSGTVAYMGHVTQITNDIQSARVPLTASNRIIVNQLFDKLPDEVQTKWTEIISGKLANINKTNEIPPSRENKRNPSSDDDSDFRDIQFPQDTALQQMQNMSDNFEDTYGFNDNEFSDADDQISRGMGKLTPSVNFLMNTDETTQKAIFESICENGPNKGFQDSDSDDEDIWAEKTTELTFGGRHTPDITKARSPGVGADSSDEEEEGTKMDVDNDPWASLEAGGGSGSAPSVAMDTSAPWGNEKSVEQEGDGWAKFDQPSASPSGGDWADFDSGPSAGGEGVHAFPPFNNPNKQDWQPAMSSSPEATMLDSPERRTPSSSPAPAVTKPLQSEIFHPESLDFANMDANQGTVPSDLKPTPSMEPERPTSTSQQEGPTSNMDQEGPTPSLEQVESTSTSEQEGPTPDTEHKGPTPDMELEVPTLTSEKEGPPCTSWQEKPFSTSEQEGAFPTSEQGGASPSSKQEKHSPTSEKEGASPTSEQEGPTSSELKEETIKAEEPLPARK